MIDYINRPKSGFVFFLNQVVLLFSVLFFGSSCFESTIKDKGKKPYEYKESITSQRLNERLNRDYNHFMDHLDEASTKIKENCFQDHTQNQKEDRKESIITGCQETRRRENNEHTLSEEEDHDEGLQNAIKPSTITAPQGTRRERIFIMGLGWFDIEYESELAEENEEPANHINRLLADFTYQHLAEMDDEMRDDHEATQRSKHAPPISKDKAIDKLKKIVKPVQLEELREWQKDCQDKQCSMCEDKCMICADKFDQDDCYSLTTGCECKQIAFHVGCMANALIASYNSMAGGDDKPEYKCPYCKKAVL